MSRPQAHLRRWGSRLDAARTRYRSWRRRRPFWAGALAIAGGATIVLLPANQYTVFALPGTAGLAGFLLGGGLIAVGLMLWAQPDQHAVFGVGLVLLSLASFLYSNLGGFLLGMLLGVFGGCLAFAWTRDEPPLPPSHICE